MPNPIASVPSSPLPIDATVNAAAEAFVSTLLQVFEQGTSGLSSTENTDPSYQQLDGAGAVGPVLLRSREQQLFFRQLGVAIATNFANLSVSVPEPYFAQTFTSAGVARGDVVVLVGEGVVGPGSCITDLGAMVLGVAKEAAAAGDPVSVVLFGSFFDILTDAVVKTEYFLGPAGSLVLFDTLTPGQRIVRMGYASSPTDLEVRITDIGVR